MMGRSSSPGPRHPHDRKHRSRSDSPDAEAGSRKHRRRERESSEDRGHARHHVERDRSTDRRDLHGDRDRKYSSRDKDHRDRDRDRDRNTEDRHRRRPRSRSPDSRSLRRHEDGRDSRDTYKRHRSPEHRSSKDKESRPSREGSATQVVRSKGPLPSQAASFQKEKNPNSAVVVADDKEIQEKQKPNFAPTGLLAAASKSVTAADGTSIVLKYHEPPEARKPPANDQWKLFVFKGSDIVDTIELSLRSCWLIGREMAVVDLAAEHPSISKQHAVIQFRYIEKKNEFGDKLGKVRPYLIDLDSANSTMLNKEEIPPSRYLELRDKDMIQFGHSTREYVLMLSPKD
ncbi:hypothetical protein B7463_g899, partial [Scytalidium lignicola]